MATNQRVATTTLGARGGGSVASTCGGPSRCGRIHNEHVRAAANMHGGPSPRHRAHARVPPGGSKLPCGCYDGGARGGSAASAGYPPSGGKRTLGSLPAVANQHVVATMAGARGGGSTASTQGGHLVCGWIHDERVWAPPPAVADPWLWSWCAHGGPSWRRRAHEQVPPSGGKLTCGC